MSVVRVIAMILLAAYLILAGLAGVIGMAVPFASFLVGLLGVSAGILILISLGGPGRK